MIDLKARRAVGRLPLPTLGLGVAPLGNLYTRVSDEQSDTALLAAERRGIGWFDVAPYYGFGLAEERLGRFLRWRAPSRDVVISTKVGRVLEPSSSGVSQRHFVDPLPFAPVFDYSAAGIRRSLEESLRRLGRDRIEILLLHDVDRVNHPVGHRTLLKQLLDESLPTLQRLKSEGLVDAIGLGVNQWDIAYEFLASADIDCVLLAGRYTLLDQSAFTSGFLDACQRRGIAVLGGGVFNSGILVGGPTYDYQTADIPMLASRDRLLTICERHSVPLPAVAIQFTAAHPAMVSVVVGARSSQEIDAILDWSQMRIPADLWTELRESTVIPNDAPIPTLAMFEEITIHAT